MNIEQDIKAFFHFARELKTPMHLLEKTTEVNASQLIKAVEHLVDVISDLTNRDVAVFGLSFKPHADRSIGRTRVKDFDKLQNIV